MKWSEAHTVQREIKQNENEGGGGGEKRKKDFIHWVMPSTNWYNVSEYERWNERMNLQHQIRW